MPNSCENRRTSASFILFSGTPNRFHSPSFHLMSLFNAVHRRSLAITQIARESSTVICGKLRCNSVSVSNTLATSLICRNRNSIVISRFAASLASSTGPVDDDARESHQRTQLERAGEICEAMCVHYECQCDECEDDSHPSTILLQNSLAITIIVRAGSSSCPHTRNTFP